MYVPTTETWQLLPIYHSMAAGQNFFVTLPIAGGVLMASGRGNDNGTMPSWDNTLKHQGRIYMRSRGPSLSPVRGLHDELYDELYDEETNSWSTPPSAIPLVSCVTSTCVFS